MKKKETRVTKNKVSETHTKEQLEDRLFHKMMLWLAAAAVTEVVMLLVNRFYVHARAGEIAAYIPLRNTLLVLFVAGIVLFAGFTAWGVQIHKRGEWKDGTLQIVLGAMFLCIGVGGFLMRNFTTSAAPLVLAAVPGLAVLALIFYLYQKEFFLCGIIGGLCIMGLWVFRSAAGSAMYYGFLGLALVITALCVVLAAVLQKKDGTITIRGKEIALFQENAVYLVCYITAAIAAILLLAPLALGAAVAYYSIWVMAAWLFILAVYFTSKLM